MYFANPLPALVALSIVSGLIVLMYILKLRRKDVVVSSTYLWRQVIRDVQANAPFQKLRKNLLLFLQLLLAALLSFALARPFQRVMSAGGHSIVLVIDTSASMRATDVAPSRLDAARQEAQQVVSRMGAGDMMMVISASSRPEAVSGFTNEKSELRRVLDNLKPHDTPTNMRDALNLAADLVAGRNGGDAGRIDLISDGGFEDGGASNGASGAQPQYTLANLNLGKTRVVFHPIGKGHDNVGITAVDFRRSIGGEKSVQMLVVTHNYSGQAHKFNEEIYFEDNLFDAHEISLPANGESTEAYDVQEPEKPVRMRVRLDVQDDLAVDNEATLILKPRKLLNVLLVGSENMWLENALKVDPGITLSKASAYPAARAKIYDVIVFNESAPAKLPEGNYLFLHCASDQSPAKTNGQMDNVGFADVEREHPALRYVDFGSENLLGVYKAAPQGWGKEIAVGESGSLIVAGEKNKMRAEFVSFSLDKSVHFMLTVAFPIFISNSVRWLGTGADDSEQGQIRTGSTLTIPAPSGTGKLTVTRPDGRKRDVVVAERGGAPFSDTDEAGLYIAEGPNYPKYVFAANLASASESDITPHKSLNVLENAAPSPTRQVLTTRELLPYIAFIALLLLCVEWYVFHRRIHLN
jgi:Ca-activated chloride channel family protein